jgi:hypothetical protein
MRLELTIGQETLILDTPVRKYLEAAHLTIL